MSLLVAVWLTAGPVVPEVVPGTPCIDATRLAERIEQLGPGGDFTLRLRGKGQAVVLEMQRPGRAALERTVPIGAEGCAAVERVVVALINAWTKPQLPTLRKAGRATLDGGVQGPQRLAERVDAGRGSGGAARGPTGGATASASAGGPPLPAPGMAPAPASPHQRGQDGAAATANSPVPREGEAPGSRPTGSGATAPPGTSEAAGALPETSRASAPTRTSEAARGSAGDASPPPPTREATPGARASAGDASPPPPPTREATPGARVSAGDASPPPPTREAAPGARASASDASPPPPAREAAPGARASASDASPPPPTREATPGARASSGDASPPPPTREAAPGVRASAGDASSSPRTSDAGKTGGSAAGISPGVSGASPPVATDGPAQARWRVWAAALGGAGLGPTDSLNAIGTLHLGASRGRWGVVLDAGLESGRAQAVPPGRLWAAMQWLSLGPSVAFRPSDGWRVDLGLALRGTRVDAGAEGFPINGQTVLWSLGAAASGAVSRRLWGPLHAQVRAFASVRAPAERLTVDNASGAFTLGPWAVGVLAGLGVEADL